MGPGCPYRLPSGKKQRRKPEARKTEMNRDVTHMKQYRLKVECYSKTPSIKVQLIPTDGSDRITVTQDIGQSLPRYQAYLVENILDVDSFEFMAFMEQNNLGHIADYKRYSMDTGGTRKTVALFKIHSGPLRKFHAKGCGSNNRHITNEN